MYLTLVLMLVLHYTQMQLVVSINEELEDIDSKLLEQVYITYVYLMRVHMYIYIYIHTPMYTYEHSKQLNAVSVFN
jgi:hypothetical protein